MKKIILLLAISFIFASCEKTEIAEPLDNYTYYVSSTECVIEYALSDKKVVDLHSENGIFPWTKDFAADDLFVPYLVLISKTTNNPIYVIVTKNGETIQYKEY